MNKEIEELNRFNELVESVTKKLEEIVFEHEIRNEMVLKIKQVLRDLEEK